MNEDAGALAMDVPLRAVEFRSPLLRLGENVVVAWFLFAAAMFALYTLAAIATLGWQQPMFDQYRSYGYLLAVPFPDNVLHLENGHRPIVPNLFRLAEIQWFGANQRVQLSVGALCIVLSALLLVACVWREKTLPRVARAAGTLLAVLGVLWLANARMMLHGNEALHAYTIVLMLVCGALCVHRAAQTQRLGWIAMACAMCAIATFCFGSGVATFPAIIALMILQRMPLKWFLLPIGTGALCVVIYAFVLPGNDSVRAMASLHPLESLRAATQCLASPWVNAWLGMADPPLEPSVRDGVAAARLGGLLIASANGLERVTASSWQTLAALLGGAGALVFMARICFAFWRREALGRLQLLCTALGLFAMAVALIIGINRLDILSVLPEEAFADRYLVWPSLFWSALAMLILSDVVRARRPVMQRALLLAAALLPLALWPTQNAWRMWGAAVFQIAQRGAAAARSDVFDPTVFPDGPDATRTDVEKSLALLKSRDLAMFAQPSWHELGRAVHVTDQSRASADARVLSTFLTDPGAVPVARIGGRINAGLSAARKGALAIVDPQDTVVGFAESSYSTEPAGEFSLPRAKKRGFDGYIRAYDAALTYRLVLLRPDQGDNASLLGAIVSQ